ncbi:hypothetical protein GCM10020219_069090 [Nonomuraea dietziae]
MISPLPRPTKTSAGGQLPRGHARLGDDEQGEHRRAHDDRAGQQDPASVLLGGLGDPHAGDHPSEDGTPVSAAFSGE